MNKKMRVEYSADGDILYLVLSNKKIAYSRSDADCTFHVSFDESDMPVEIEISPARGTGAMPIFINKNKKVS